MQQGMNQNNPTIIINTMNGELKTEAELHVALYFQKFKIIVLSFKKI
jgi:hypothetical protein